jgi:hypothetical protein
VLYHGSFRRMAAATRSQRVFTVASISPVSA